VSIGTDRSAIRLEGNFVAIGEAAAAPETASSECGAGAGRERGELRQELTYDAGGLDPGQPGREAVGVAGEPLVVDVDEMQERRLESRMCTGSLTTVVASPDSIRGLAFGTRSRVASFNAARRREGATRTARTPAFPTSSRGSRSSSRASPRAPASNGGSTKSPSPSRGRSGAARSGPEPRPPRGESRVWMSQTEDPTWLGPGGVRVK
jgi:hypothetical protein